MYNKSMHIRRDACFFFLITGVFFILITLPYLWAAQAAGQDFDFGGMLLNPMDGNSYLAKMYQGWQGNWQFRLPFTADPGEEAYLFLYYLMLGHLARLDGLSLLLTFHLARLGASLLMLLALWRFYVRVMPSPDLYRLAFALTVFGSGLGWLAISFGILTSDLWVAEAYPFLSAYANPHFPLGLAMLVWLLTPQIETDKFVKEQLSGHNFRHSIIFRMIYLLAAFALGIVMPFGVIVAVLVLGGVVVWEVLGMQLADRGSMVIASLWRSFTARKLFLLIIGGVTVLAYDLWVTATNPVLKGWHAQNLTPSPPFWDFLLSFAPIIVLALPGAWSAWRSQRAQQNVLLVWFAVGVMLLYLPFGLQRRFMLGLAIPFAGLAALGLQALARGNKRRTLAMIVWLFLLVLPTNLVVLMTSVHGVLTHAPLLYLGRGEAQALEWLAKNTPEEAVILAATDTGMFIPAHSGRRVVYGHPFETLAARERAAMVNRLFQGAATHKDLELLQEVDYVFVGPRERAWGEAAFTGGMVVVYQAGGVTVYQVGEGNE